MTRTILLFAPEGPFADELRRELERLGHAVTRVHDAEAGLREAERHGPDLVLVGTGLPGTSGYWVCNRLESSPATQIRESVDPAAAERSRRGCPP